MQLNNSLVEHGIRHFDKSGNVRAYNEIAWLTVLVRGFPSVFEDRGHDVAQTRINFFPRPR